jgi:hypothetical protein
MFDPEDDRVAFEDSFREDLVNAPRERIARVVVPIGAGRGEPPGEMRERVRPRLVDRALEGFADAVQHLRILIGEECRDGGNQRIAVEQWLGPVRIRQRSRFSHSGLDNRVHDHTGRHPLQTIPRTHLSDMTRAQEFRRFMSPFEHMLPVSGSLFTSGATIYDLHRRPTAQELLFTSTRIQRLLIS